MDGKLVSIIIPVYNVSAYLKKSVESIFSQDFANIEIILVDDGSTDCSSEICDELQKQNSCIKVVHKKNEGVAVARNAGIKLATGDFIMFLDSDDTYSEGLFQKLNYEIEEKGSDIVVFGYQKHDENSIVFYKSLPPPNCTKEMLLKEYKDLTFLLVNKCFKRNLFESVELSNVEDIVFCEDSYLSQMLFLNANVVTIIPYIGYNYLCRRNSATQTMSKRHRNDYFKAVGFITSLYKGRLEEPLVLKRLQAEARFAQINPDYDFVFFEFMNNCKVYRESYPESNIFVPQIATTKLMRLYVALIMRGFYLIAYLLYSIRKRRVRV